MIDQQRQIRDILDRLERLEKPDIGGQWTAYSPTYEGSSSPGVTTYSVQQGWYLRLGPIALVTGLVAWTAVTGTGNAQVGLPLTPSASAGFRASGGFRVSSVTFTTTTPMLIMSPSLPFFTMESPVSNAVGNVVQMEAAGNITFSLFYGVD